MAPQILGVPPEQSMLKLQEPEHGGDNEVVGKLPPLPNGTVQVPSLTVIWSTAAPTQETQPAYNIFPEVTRIDVYNNVDDAS